MFPWTATAAQAGEPADAHETAGAGSANLKSAEVCRDCHPEVYKTWNDSMHPKTFTDPAFQLPYSRIRSENPGLVVICEHCHNPLGNMFPPDDPKAAIFAREGVTCDFCHSVEAVDRDGHFPRFVLSPGTKFGPYLDGGKSRKSPHKKRFSQLHLTSDLCAGCHEFRNRFGVPILSTFSEWKESYYRGKEVHCQFCHIPQLFGAGFIEEGKRDSPLSHEMIGGHSPARLSKAIPVRASLTVFRDTARLDVQIKNEFVGHKTPGIPLHRIRLVTSIFDKSGILLGKNEEFFEKVVGDGEGNPLTKPEDVFTAARQVLKDNRIGPKETRDIVRTVRIGGSRPSTATVDLIYEIPVPDNVPGKTVIDIPFSSMTVEAKKGFSSLMIAAAVIFAGVLLAMALLVRWKLGAAKPAG
jgi:hypothetical protein